MLHYTENCLLNPCASTLQLNNEVDKMFQLEIRLFSPAGIHLLLLFCHFSSTALFGLDNKNVSFQLNDFFQI